jgi:hypothetical protein
MSKRLGTKGPDPGTGGAPRRPIDAELCRRLASIGCTMAEIATANDVNIDTLFHRIELEPELGDIIEDGREQGRTTLRRMQWQNAQKGSDTMLIWLGKQMLGQRDQLKQTIEGDTDNPLSLIAMHLLAAQTISGELAGQPPTIEASASANGTKPNGHDKLNGKLHLSNLLNAPLPEE